MTRRTRTLVAGTLVAAAPAYAVLAATVDPGTGRNTVFAFLFAFVAALAGVAAIRAARDRASAGRSFRLLGAGSLLAAVGALAFAVGEHFSPALAIAYPAVMAVTPLHAAAVLTWPRRADRRWRSLGLNAVVAAALAVVAMVAYLVVPLWEQEMSGETAPLFAYVLVDLALTAIVVAGLVAERWLHSDILTVVGAALLCELVGDTAYALDRGGDPGGTLAETMWVAASAFIGLAAVTRPGGLELLTLKRRQAGYLIAAGVGAVWTAETARHWSQLPPVDRFEHVLSGTLVLMLIVAYWRAAIREEREADDVRHLLDELATTRARERKLRDRFLARVVDARDTESRRIAQFLHDDAVQRLAALALRLELVALRTGEPSVADLAREAHAITAAIRPLLLELHPVVLESQGLCSAIDAAAGPLRARGVDVDVETLRDRFSPAVEQLAYRLVQEAFENVAAHADARSVTVELDAGAVALTCRIQDDGRGFMPNGADGDARAVGLELARERVELAGGRFWVESAPGTGTTFAFELPLVERAVEPVGALA